MTGQIAVLGGDQQSEMVRDRVEAGLSFAEIVNLDRVSPSMLFVSLISVDGFRIALPG